mmetsp:Transcript_5752/g.22701  ORF Transcript_5752/g.22701 Transcript_5752/m.22701 type:complete len:224 (+) Transcript_5752:935-1606(+)
MLHTAIIPRIHPRSARAMVLHRNATRDFLGFFFDGWFSSFASSRARAKPTPAKAARRRAVAKTNAVASPAAVAATARSSAPPATKSSVLSSAIARFIAASASDVDSSAKACAARKRYSRAAKQGSRSSRRAASHDARSHAVMMLANRTTPPHSCALMSALTNEAPPFASALAHQRAVASKASSPARLDTRSDTSAACAAAQEAEKVTASASAREVSRVHRLAY